MTYFLTAQICLNGHMITSSTELSPELKQDYCSKCGAKTITKCPCCNAPIRGKLHDDEAIIIAPHPRVDSYCTNCGKPYPWTKTALESTALLIQEEEELSEQLKASLVESLPDVITETPRTNLAFVRVKKCLANAGKFTADAVRQFAIDFGCELVKKSLGL